MDKLGKQVPDDPDRTGAWASDRRGRADPEVQASPTWLRTMRNTGPATVDRLSLITMDLLERVLGKTVQSPFGILGDTR